MRRPLGQDGKFALEKDAETRDRTGDLQIFSLTLSQLSYRGSGIQEPRALMVVTITFALCLLCPLALCSFFGFPRQGATPQISEWQDWDWAGSA